MSQMLKSSGSMSLATMTSRLLGLAREVVYARFMGTGWVADAFILAFMVPNLFRRLLGEGALTAAFIPIFKEKEKLEGEKEMWHATNAVVSGLAASAAALVAVGVLGISALLVFQPQTTQIRHLLGAFSTLFPWILGASVVALLVRFFQRGNQAPQRRWANALVSLAAIASVALLIALAAGTIGSLRQSFSGKTLLMLELLRVMFPYLFLVCLAAIFMGMLNARGHFFVPALGATMLNVVMIASVLWLAPKLGTTLNEQIFGLAIGVLIAGIAQAVFQLPLLHKEGYRPRWVNPWHNETVRKVVTRMIPGAVGVAAFQINVVITQTIAFSVDAGVVSSFNYAVRLMELPQGVFGIALGTYLLTTLSGLAAEKKYPEFRTTLAQGLDWIVFINLLAAVFLFTLAEPMMRLLFERGEFTDVSTFNSALALKCLAPGLVAFSMVNILARAFYSLGDTFTPMKIGVVCLALNAVVAIVLVWHYKQAGLGVANSLSALLNMGLLIYALRRKLKTLELTKLRAHLTPLLGAAALAGTVSWLLASLWTTKVGHTTLLLRVGEVFVPMTIASLVYLATTAAFKTGHTEQLLRFFRKS